MGNGVAPPNVNSSARKEMDIIVFPSCDGCGLKSWDCSKQAGISAYWGGKEIEPTYLTCKRKPVYIYI